MTRYFTSISENCVNCISFSKCPNTVGEHTADWLVSSREICLWLNTLIAQFTLCDMQGAVPKSRLVQTDVRKIEEIRKTFEFRTLASFSLAGTALSITNPPFMLVKL